MRRLKMRKKCGSCDKFKKMKYTDETDIGRCVLDGLCRDMNKDYCEHWQENEVKYALDDCERLVRK